MNFSHLIYTTPPLCSALRCQPMGTWTGTACLSSPASQSFPPFIAPLVLRSTPQRYIYQTSTSVFAMHVMFVFQSRGGGGGGRVVEMGTAAQFTSTGNSALRGSWWGGRWVGGWSGRVRRAHGRPYPLSCFMATVLINMWTSITASWCSEPSDSRRCWLKQLSQELVCAVLSQEGLLLFVFSRPGCSPSVGQVVYVQHIGSQTWSCSGIPMVPMWAEQRRNAHKLMVKAMYFFLHGWNSIM